MRLLPLIPALCAIALFSGCQSCTSLPIVGDSMSQWGCSDGRCSPPTTMMAANQPQAMCGICGTPGCGGQCMVRRSAMMAARNASTGYGMSAGPGYPCQGPGNTLGGGYGRAGCGPGGCPPGGGYGMAGKPPGCGGNVCNGSCRGRCPLAQKAARLCAYGACGGSQGPQHGQVTFPYYTIRGPRDFLNPNPPSIGP
jgi:hypothetical protein